MSLKSLQELKDFEKSQAMDIHTKWNAQTNHFFSELLSKYPVKKITLEEARELLDTRLEEQELSEVVREMRNEP